MKQYTQNHKEPTECGASNAKSFAEIPGPRKTPLIGNLHQINLRKLHLTLENWSEAFGPIYKFYLGTRPVVAIADETVINAILRARPQGYRRWSAIETVFEEMGIKGVFSIEGEGWKRQRRLAMRALNSNHLHLFFPALARVTRRLKKRWESAAIDGVPVNVQKDLMRYTVDITTELAFGYDINTLEREDNVIQAHLENIFPMVNQRINAALPYWRYFRLPKDRAVDESLAIVHREITRFIDGNRALMRQRPDLHDNPTNFLQGMLARQEEDSEGYSDEEIAGNALTMLLAGEDTTANTLAWLSHFLLENPAILDEMRREVDSLLGDTDIPKDFNAVAKLRYIEAVTYETLRLKPAAPIVFIETNSEVSLTGYLVPAGTALILLTRKVGLQEKNMSDANQFKPERWLTSPASENKQHNSNAFIPFGAGPRFCPGRNLALMEMKTVAAMLCRNFHLTRSNPEVPVGEHFGFTMMPTNLMVNFSRREQ